MNQEAWHYYNWKEWHNRVYGTTIIAENLIDSGKMHHQSCFFEIDSNGEIVELYPRPAEDTYYFKAQKGSHSYLIPKRFVDQFPIIPKPEGTLPVRLKKAETAVYQFVRDVESLKIPQKRLTSFKDMVDSFNPVSHEDPDTAVLLKLVALIQGICCGVCAEVGSGKNSNFILMKNIFGRVAPKIKASSKAMFYSTMYHNDQINPDEITSWKRSEVGLIEDLVVDVADGAPDQTKYAKDTNKLLESMDLAQKGIVFTFNPVSKDNPHLFSTRWYNYDKIADRYPLFLLGGKVLDSISDPTPNQVKDCVDTHFKEMCDIVSNIAYWRANLHKDIGYSQVDTPFRRRHFNNLKPLLDGIWQYSGKNMDKFRRWVSILKLARDDYRAMEKDASEPVK